MTTRHCWPLKAALFLALLAAPALAAPLFGASSQAPGLVVRCFDGDTVKLSDRRIVRLAGIDAPEVYKKTAQYYSRQAREALASMIKGKKIELVPAGSKPKDRHGRLVADLRLPDGESVSESMLERGAAFFYPHKDLDPEYMERLKEIQADAIVERRGMWEHVLSLPLARENYVGDRDNLRFFPINCPTAGRIKPRNRVHFGTLMDAFLAGYAPARECVFWPNEEEAAQ